MKIRGGGEEEEEEEEDEEEEEEEEESEEEKLIRAGEGGQVSILHWRGCWKLVLLNFVPAFGAAAPPEVRQLRGLPSASTAHYSKRESIVLRSGKGLTNL